jgi:hypothetical protein
MGRIAKCPECGKPIALRFPVHHCERKEKPVARLVALRFDDNYADEFDVVGLKIVERKWWEKYRERVRDEFQKLPRDGYYFGTNEYLEWSNAEDYLSCITQLDITQAQIITLRTILGDEFGIFPVLEFDE